jgi:hypothetical protein
VTTTETGTDRDDAIVGRSRRLLPGRTPLIRRVGDLIAPMLLAAACGSLTAPPGQEPIPSGATVVRVATSSSDVTLEPATVPAGVVYLVLDEPVGGSVSFVQRQANPNQPPGPLNNGDLVRLARGDTKHTHVTGLDAGGCSDDQNRQARGMLGPCGNVLELTLEPGKYAIVAGAPEADPATGATAPMAVLEVGR